MECVDPGWSSMPALGDMSSKEGSVTANSDTVTLRVWRSGVIHSRPGAEQSCIKSGVSQIQEMSWGRGKQRAPRGGVVHQ